MNEIGFGIPSIQIGGWKIAQVPDLVAFICGVMGAVYTMDVVENTFYYPLLQSNLSSDLCGLS